MSNEEIVMLVQAGDSSKLLELWKGVERFVWQQANRRYLLSNGLGGITAEDLYQSGYIALVSAVDSYNPVAGKAFVGWLSLALKTQFSEAAGIRSRKQGLDPLHRAGSLDMPARRDDLDDGDPLAELLPDPAAEAAFEDVAERDRLDRLRVAVRNAVDELPPDQRAAVREKFWGGKTVDDKVLRAALRALRHPRISRALQAAM